MPIILSLDSAVTTHLKEGGRGSVSMDTDVADPPDTTTVDSICQALLSSVQQTSTDVMTFVRRCRSARADLASTTRELSELRMVLELLDDHGSQEGAGGIERKRAIPEELQVHLRPILTNCATMVQRIDDTLRNHGNEASEGAAVSWTVQDRDEVRELRKALGVYRSVLGLVSDLVSILVSSGGKEEGSEAGESSLGGVDSDGLKLPNVLRELKALRSSTLASLGIANLAGQHLALQVHLGHIIAYTETLARSGDWEKAGKVLDQAQKKTATAEKEDPRGSAPVTAPLRRISATKEFGGVGDDFIVLNKGFENFLVRGDGGQSTSLLFASHSKPEPGSLMSGDPSTGMMIMDGAGLPGMSGTNTSLQPTLQSTSSSTHPRRAPRRRTSEQQQHAMIYTTEKEVAVPVSTGRRGPEEEVTEEALAFAQVPVHILGRLSLNLVGHVYTGTTSHEHPNEPNTGNASGSSEKTSYIQSLSTMKTEEECFDDGASSRTSDMGSLHDGDLQFSQLDLSKPPVAAIARPLPPSQTTLSSQTSSRSQGTHSSQQPQRQLSQRVPQLLPPLPPLPLPPPPSSQQSIASVMSTPIPAPSCPIAYAQSLPGISHSHHERAPSTSAQSAVYGPRPPPPPPPPPPGHAHAHGLREMRSISTMNTHTFINMQKPLPRTPLVYIPSYPGPFVRTKAVVVGNFSCGKTCLIT